MEGLMACRTDLQWTSQDERMLATDEMLFMDSPFFLKGYRAQTAIAKSAPQCTLDKTMRTDGKLHVRILNLLQSLLTEVEWCGLLIKLRL